MRRLETNSLSSTVEGLIDAKTTYSKFRSSLSRHHRWGLQRSFLELEVVKVVRRIARRVRWGDREGTRAIAVVVEGSKDEGKILHESGTSR